MPIEISMPRLSDTMQQGTVVKWNIKEGQKVSSGDVIADIETDKATMELQTFDDGTVAKLAVGEGQTVSVGTVIAVLAAQGESVEDAKKAAAGAGGAEGRSAPKQASDRKQAQAQGVGFSETESVGTATLTRESEPKTGRGAPTAPSADGAGDGGAGGRIFVSPLARKMADEHGLDLAELKGTGPSGRIVRKDIEAALDSPALRAGLSARSAEVPTPLTLPSAGAALQPRTVPLSNMRRVIARRLVESKQTIPHYQVTVEADMDALLALRSTLNEQLASQGVKLSVNDFIVRACALAMHQHPFVNSRWAEDNRAGNASNRSPAPEPHVEILGEVNIGIAIALPEERGGGLVVATIRNADMIGLRQISHQSKALADKARAKGLAPNEMEGATFTLSNLGMFGVEHFTAIINPPNVCILAVGAAIEKPIVKDGQLTIGHRMAMTMSSDHRVVDGAMAAQYLNTVKTLLQQPAALLV